MPLLNKDTITYKAKVNMSKTIHTISLGCAKNLVDSERLLGSMASFFTPVNEAQEADLILINTCAFLETAVYESIEVIVEAGFNKKRGAFLVVAGCLAARYQEEDGQMLGTGLPEVDLFLPPDEYSTFEEKITKLMNLKHNFAQMAFGPSGAPTGPRFISTPPFRAYLKIAEGCDNHCTYCLIPTLRGHLASTPLDQLLAEAKLLAEGGVKELTLVAQDTTAYGDDLNMADGLLKLVEALSKLPQLEWIRLLYAYPERLTEKMVKTLANTPKVVPYLDLPFQHGSVAVLKRMGRKVHAPPLTLVENIKSWWPEVALRSTVIVGFPGETEAEFDELSSFVEKAQLNHLGVFKFSPEDGTLASTMPGQLSKLIKEKRRRRIMSIQRKISHKLNKEKVGQIVPVLVEGLAPDSNFVLVGRAQFQAPEVDGLVYFEGEAPLPGQIVQTRLLKAAPYDFVGTLASSR
ncbi:MAG: 30S ribosomal protein S12 methylthiotransferase RimO [Candidatus Adiutrix sp.]